MVYPEAVVFTQGGQYSWPVRCSVLGADQVGFQQAQAFRSLPGWAEDTLAMRVHPDDTLPPAGARADWLGGTLEVVAQAAQPSIAPLPTVTVRWVR